MAWDVLSEGLFMKTILVLFGAIIVGAWFFIDADVDRPLLENRVAMGA